MFTSKDRISLRIRLAKLKDLDEIERLSQEAIVSSIPKRKLWLKEYTQKARAKEYEDLKHTYPLMRDKVKVLVAELKGEIIGYLVLMLGVKDSSTGYPHAWIFDLFVKEEYRRKGVAKKLLKIAEDIAARSGYRYIGLTVTSENTPAVNLYTKLGYLEERKVMVKELIGGDEDGETSQGETQS